jgi:hypothetical protein
MEGPSASLQDAPGSAAPTPISSSVESAEHDRVILEAFWEPDQPSKADVSERLGPLVAVPSVKGARNGSFRTCDRDLPIRRSGPDERGFPAVPDELTVGFRIDHGWRDRSQAAIAPETRRHPRSLP